MSEIDILDTDIGGIKLKDATAMTVLQWLSKKLDNVKAYDASVVELTALLTNPPMSRTMPDEKKIEIVMKLRKLNISI